MYTLKVVKESGNISINYLGEDVQVEYVEEGPTRAYVFNKWAEGEMFPIRQGDEAYVTEAGKTIAIV